jgi:two-component system, chemotaxis family, protein-glutamate methylesterase/glutaminase
VNIVLGWGAKRRVSSSAQAAILGPSNRNGHHRRSLGNPEGLGMPKKDIVVIGGSAGSHAVLQQIVSDLPADLPASIFVTTHMPAGGVSLLPDILSRVSRMPVVRAVDGQPIEPGCVYVAVPDHHLLVIDGTVRFGNGPRENMTRPAIDPLFRSAALSHGPRTVGVVLSGLLNDGASGLSAIKACGGTAVVQSPLDAHADQMPLSALEVVDADQVVPTADLGRVLAQIVYQNADAEQHCPDSVALEVQIAGGARLGAEALLKIADPTALTCPDCQGVLSEVRAEQPLRFRCQIGHAMTAEVLKSRAGDVHEALTIALRIMEERVTLVTRMAEDARRMSRSSVAELYEGRVEEYGRYAAMLRDAATASLRDRQSPQEEASARSEEPLE